MKKILVIDDDKDLSGIVANILKYKGYDAIVTNDANDGIQKAKQEKPDLIIMDIMMPSMDGTEAIQILNQDSATSSIPVIFLTGLVSNQDQNQGVGGIQIGKVQYKSLGKPFENAKLLEMVEESIR